MAGTAMTLCERLRNPAYIGLPGNAVMLHLDHTRNDMREAATRIEVLQAALDLRNAEVVTALKWLDGRAILLAALKKICEPIAITGDADTITACQDLHELIVDIAEEAIAKAGKGPAPAAEPLRDVV